MLSINSHFSKAGAAPEGSGLLFVQQGVTVYQSHVECLEEGRCLNDTIIDFYLNYLWSRLPTKRREKLYVFSSFFWSKLCANPVDDPKEMHARVKRWTKNVDLFEKDFLLIPINEHGHWYLAIVCFPGLDGPITKNTLVKIDGLTYEKKAIAKGPRIFILDSLKGRKRYTTTKRLRQYLIEEWSEKKSDFGYRKFVGQSYDEPSSGAVIMTGCYPTAPKQDNSSDCGVFLLEYAERFMTFGLPGWIVDENGMEFGPNVRRDLTGWFEVNRGKEKRKELSKLVTQLAKEWWSSRLDTIEPENMSS